MHYHFRNLVFEGGGVKGIAYVGALTMLQEKGVLQDIKRVGGTSAGAIVALLLALDYTIPEIDAALRTMDFTKFLDSTWGVIRNTDRLFKEFGWYKGDFFKNWISEMIERKTASKYTTFRELEQMKLSRQLYLVGTNLSTGFAEIYSAKHSPDTALADAVRISMSIPIFFTAVFNQNKEVLVDGGILENYPIRLFDRKSYVDDYFSRKPYYDTVNSNSRLEERDSYVFNMETLGFRLDTNREINIFEKQVKPEAIQINSFYDFIKRLVGTMLDSQQNRHLHSDDWQRTIYIDTLSVRTTDFEITEEKMNALVHSGYQCTERYFTWFESSNENPTNKPERFY